MLSNADRERLFGRFDFKPAPTPDNPERVDIDDTWEKEHIIRVALAPLLPGVRGPQTAWMHKEVVPHFEALLQAWKQAGLLPHIKTWNGCYAARFRRGITPPVLSAHAWGSAFDINAAWNPLGKAPAAPGAVGSVWELATVAEKHGWVWGGRWKRPDGMHFELGRV